MKKLNEIMATRANSLENFAKEYGDNISEILTTLLNCNEKECEFLRGIFIRAVEKEIGTTICMNHNIRPELCEILDSRIGEYLIEDVLTVEDEIHTIVQTASEVSSTASEFASLYPELYDTYSKPLKRPDPSSFALKNSDLFWEFLTSPLEGAEVKSTSESLIRHEIGDTVVVIADDMRYDGMTGVIMNIYEEYHDHLCELEPFLCHMVKLENGELVGFPGAELD